MALNAYIAQVQSLLDDPNAVEYSTANLTTFINDARVQIAGASESIRELVNFTLSLSQQQVLYSSVGSLPSGVQGVLTLRKARVGSGAVWNELAHWEWERFFSFLLCGTAVNTTGTPTTFAEFQRGTNGSIYIYPLSSGTLTLSADAVCYPINLALDSDPELLPYPWTEAIQYYAAFLALLNAQRYGDADSMFERYQVFERRATQMTTPTTLPLNLPGGPGAHVAATMTPLTASPQAGAA